MFKIGDFSKFSCVSVKMLRHYDEIGLLSPARVDPLTGYRYYSADQLPRLNRIIALKELGFSLDQIKHLLDSYLPLEQLKGMLRLRRAEIYQQLRVEECRLAEVEMRLWRMEQEQRQPYDVIVRNILPQRRATLRAVVPSLGPPISALFDEVEAYVARYKARAMASPLMIFHDAEYREVDLEVEVAVPLAEAIPPCERIQVNTISGGLMACAVYTGNYNKTPEVLNAMLIWLEINRYEMNGTLREVYLRFGADQAEVLGLPTAFITDDSHLYVTELQLPIHPSDHLLNQDEQEE